MVLALTVLALVLIPFHPGYLGRSAKQLTQCSQALAAAGCEKPEIARLYEAFGQPVLQETVDERFSSGLIAQNLRYTI